MIECLVPTFTRLWDDTQNWSKVIGPYAKKYYFSLWWYPTFYRVADFNDEFNNYKIINLYISIS
jgi:hypothetical protein